PRRGPAAAEGPDADRPPRSGRSPPAPTLRQGGGDGDVTGGLNPGGLAMPALPGKSRGRTVSLGGSALAALIEIERLTKRFADRTAHAMTLTQLEGVRLQPVETLSKGFKRRVGLAQALLHDPPVLVLDEPTDGLDPNQKHEVRELIRRMAPEKAIVISTHILEEVEAVCTRAVIIAAGRVVADSTPKEL